MAKELTAYGFRGMSNRPSPVSIWTDREGRLTPEIIVNADVLDDGVITKRQGQTLLTSLDNAHSLWAGTKMFCVADGDAYDGSLWRIDGSSATEVCEVTGAAARVSYVELNGLVYMGNANWSCVYDLDTDTVRDWGVSIPDAPSVSIVDGDLPPGTYVLTYTNSYTGVEYSLLGGNGPFVKIILEGDSRGIQLNNLPSGGLAWITHPNGGKLFLASVSSDVISRQAPEMQPLPTMGVQPPPGFRFFTYAFGRIWGIVGSNLYYSDPNQYEWFRASNFLPFTDELIMLVPVDNGMFVHSLKNTWFLAGNVPGEMSLHHVGYGAIPGAMAYASIQGGGYELSQKLTQQKTAVWLTAKGFVAGTDTGHLVYLTDDRIKFVGREQGACLAVTRDGVSRILASLWGDPIDYEDDVLEEIFTNKKLS